MSENVRTSNLNSIAGASVVYTSSSASNYTVSDTTKDDGSYSFTIEDETYLPGKLVVKADGYEEYTKNISKEDFVEGICELPISLRSIVPPGPGPQPQPGNESQSEFNSSVAQTGDILGIVMTLLVVVALSSGTYVVRKKFAE